MSKHLSNLILTHKGAQSMDALARKINAAAGADRINAATLYSYVNRHRRPEPKQAGILARYMAQNPRERGELLAAYLEDTLDATDIPPSERYLRIILAVAEAVEESAADYNTDSPDRERDLARLRDAWHTDSDLRNLLHSLANLATKPD